MDQLLSQEHIDRKRVKIGELIGEVGERVADDFGGSVTVDVEPVTLYTSREAVDCCGRTRQQRHEKRL